LTCICEGQRQRRSCAPGRAEGAEQVGALPTAVLGLLLLIASASLAMAGYNSALRRRGDRWRLTSFAMVLAGLMYIILDYDMMMRGLIQVDQQSTILLIEEMQKAVSASQ
jgi:hypothetical protein